MTLNPYLYAFADPVRYADPSGQIAEEEAELALDIIRVLRDEYGVFIEVDFGYRPVPHPAPGQPKQFWVEGAWEFAELDLVQKAVADLGAELGSAQRFRRVVGQVNVHRVPWWDLDAYACRVRRGFYPRALTPFNTVKLYDGVFNQEDFGVKVAIVHEIAHAWDWGTWASWSIGCFVGHERKPTEYAETNASEHWAETVASWVYNEYPERQRRSLGPRHREYVRLVATGQLPFIHFMNACLRVTFTDCSWWWTTGR